MPKLDRFFARKRYLTYEPKHKKTVSQSLLNDGDTVLLVYQTISQLGI